MKATAKLTRPRRMEVGGTYLWREPSKAADLDGCRLVILVSYEPCPALLIVRDAEGKRWRCPRDEIFIRNGDLGKE